MEGGRGDDREIGRNLSSFEIGQQLADQFQFSDFTIFSKEEKFQSRLPRNDLIHNLLLLGAAASQVYTCCLYALMSH